ncbi:hypothetical protein EW145_g984 [Phellinidium pouzarii]|uniref:Homeobox domain-containing protein n=1 Tax=Phellinidium pouzarii TaxID=167371 RepID=A0A4S4LG61_9AGAM|nr:hypothetical protein EW145_g984 [Phellinidium pouzarii]
MEAEQGSQQDTHRTRRASPSPSHSYYDDDDGDDELEDDQYAREQDQGPHLERSTIGSTAFAPVGTSIAAVPQQKPKRTRQLTTPEQTRALQELLAQSRFPTTAVREDIGRRIGLSARKVQVWFQNQRQKAKKASKDVAAPPSPPQRSGLPQFGAYTSVPTDRPYVPTAHPSTSFIEGPSTGAGSFRGSPGESSLSATFHDPHRGHALPPLYTSAEQSGRLIARRGSAPEPQRDTQFLPPMSTSFGGPYGARLTGPGVPGAGEVHDTNTFMQAPTPPHRTQTQLSTYSRPSPEVSLRLPLVHDVTPPLPPIMHYEGQAVTPSYGSERLGCDLSSHPVRLPPLQLDREQRRSFPRQTSMPHATHFTTQASITSMSPRSFPPPFTLEPTPVWMPNPSASSTRTHSSPESRAEPTSLSPPNAIKNVPKALDRQQTKDPKSKAHSRSLSAVLYLPARLASTLFETLKRQ